MSIGGHQSPVNGKSEWLTPPEIVQALGPFDLDPCWMPSPLPETANEHWTWGGLEGKWFGRVWLNPPYGRPSIIRPWVRKMAEHNHGTMIIFARTETEMFFEDVWNKASALFFLRGRLHFYHADGRRAEANAGAPSALVAYGKDDAMRLATSMLRGKFIPLIDMRR